MTRREKSGISPNITVNTFVLRITSLQMYRLSFFTYSMVNSFKLRVDLTAVVH